MWASWGQMVAGRAERLLVEVQGDLAEPGEGVEQGQPDRLGGAPGGGRGAEVLAPLDELGQDGRADQGAEHPGGPQGDQGRPGPGRPPSAPFGRRPQDQQPAGQDGHGQDERDPGGEVVRPGRGQVADRPVQADQHAGGQPGQAQQGDQQEGRPPGHRHRVPVDDPGRRRQPGQQHPGEDGRGRPRPDPVAAHAGPDGGAPAEHRGQQPGQTESEPGQLDRQQRGDHGHPHPPGPGAVGGQVGDEPDPGGQLPHHVQDQHQLQAAGEVVEPVAAVVGVGQPGRPKLPGQDRRRQIGQERRRRQGGHGPDPAPPAAPTPAPHQPEAGPAQCIRRHPAPGGVSAITADQAMITTSTATAPGRIPGGSARAGTAGPAGPARRSAVRHRPAPA